MTAQRCPAEEQAWKWGGVPPVVRPSPEKQWQAIEVQWELARTGRASPDLVESIIALSTWMFMILREGLSLYGKVYSWIGQHRGHKKVMTLPIGVRRELAGAAVALLMLGQDLTMGWNRRVYMMDASEEGGGIVSTVGTLEEIYEEGRWGVRGGWIKLVQDSGYFEHYRPTEVNPKVPLVLQPQQKLVRVYRFIHLFSGLVREGDLDFYFTRLGAQKGIIVIVESIDLGYGQDLGDQELVSQIRARGKPKYYSGAHNGSPCSTWSIARWRPNGPPPLRTRSSPWGAPRGA